MFANPSIKYGVYAGVALIVTDLILYLISPKAMIFASSWIALAVIIVSMVLATKEYKEANEGMLSFKEGFTASWLTYLFTGLITTVFAYLLYNFIAPDLLDEIKAISAESLEKMKGFMGEDGYEAAMENLENESSMDIPSLLISLALKYLMAAVPALIIAAVMKRERDPFA
ncbi:MAG: DUF4199 domain-containing protein [Saprospiraceae bacterium]|nr:DUF4199 domain-containing protein [Saprospiraceae bacterium]